MKTGGNNKRILCRSYSDSELAKHRNVELETRSAGLLSFSTSNLRSRQIYNRSLNADGEKFAKKKKGQSSLSMKIKGLTKLIGFARKKGMN